MMNSEVLKQVILEQRKIFLKPEDQSIKREILQEKYFDKIIHLKEVVIITGVRRCGKSYLMKLIWQKISQENKIAQENFLYINFENEKLLNFKAEDFDSLIENYLELFDYNRKQKIYLFLDEIQNIEAWEKFLNRLLEGKKYKIFVTGSNATLLSKEINTALTGRNYPIFLYPLSFKEFVAFKLKHSLNIKAIYDQEIRIKVKKLFQEYLSSGGFPEIVRQNFRPLLQEYLKNIIYRDIVLRYHIRNETFLREIVAFIISNISVPLSLEKISQMTRVKNLTTIKNYLGYLENSFLFYFMPKHSYSLKKQIYNPDKAYVCDSGLYNEIAFTESANWGRLLENIVFMELKRRRKNIYYYSNKNECDFLIQEKNKITQAIQVTHNLSEQNKERGLNGLKEVLEKYSLKKGLILTENQSVEIKEKNIIIKPIWQWCLFG